MASTTATAQLLKLLTEPLKGCKGKGLHVDQQHLMRRVMRMPDRKVRNHLDQRKASHCLGT